MDSPAAMSYPYSDAPRIRDTSASWAAIGRTMAGRRAKSAAPTKLESGMKKLLLVKLLVNGKN